MLFRMLEKKDHGHCNTTSDDIWSRDMVTHEISERETSSDSEKHGKINAECNIKRQDQEWSHKIKDKSERRESESESGQDTLPERTTTDGQR